MQPLKFHFSNKIDWHSLINSGYRIFIGTNAAVPNSLIDRLMEDGKDLNDIELTHKLSRSEES